MGMTIPLKIKPYDHQVEAYKKMIQVKRGALFMEMGTGKTLAAVAVASKAYQDREIKRLLIVCPASVMEVWAKEFQLGAVIPFRLEILIGAVVKRAEKLIKWKDTEGLQIVVTNYEGARGMPKALGAWSADMIIFDEAHKLKTPGSQQSKVLAKVAQGAKWRLALTGTPITNSPMDAFGIYRAIDPEIFGSSFYSFRGTYAIMGGFERKQVVAYKNMDDFKDKLHRIAFRVRKDECLDLPEMTDMIRTCRLDPLARHVYEDLATKAVTELESGETIVAANILTKILRLSQVTGGFLEGSPVSDAKLKLLEEVLDELAGEKAVIFCRFTDEIRAIEKLLKKLGIESITLDGSTPMAERGTMIERFQKDPSCQIFVGQIATAGIGITLTAASTAIFYSLGYSFAELDQARSRIHRSGQTKKVTNVFLVVKGSIDEKVLAVLSKKKNLAEEIVDRWRDFFSGLRAQ